MIFSIAFVFWGFPWISFKHEEHQDRHHEIVAMNFLFVFPTYSVKTHIFQSQINRNDGCTKPVFGIWQEEIICSVAIKLGKSWQIKQSAENNVIWPMAPWMIRKERNHHDIYCYFLPEVWRGPAQVSLRKLAWKFGRWHWIGLRVAKSMLQVVELLDTFWFQTRWISDRDASRNMLPASHPLTGIPQPEGDTSWGGHSWGFVSPEPNLLPRSTQHLQHHFWSIWECTTPEWHTHCTFLPLWTRGLELTYPCFPFFCVSFLVIIDMFRRNIVQWFFFCLWLLAVINID